MMNAVNWKLLVQRNEFLKCYVAPELGGRMMQLELDGFDYFFVNPGLFDRQPSKTRLGRGGGWLNYGGEKVWPAPQGWGQQTAWPGPPDPVLDGGVYEVNRRKDQYGLTMVSPKDDHTGLQIEKNIQIADDESKISISISFFNHTDQTRKWAIWPVVQLKTSHHHPGRYRAFCPVNPNSRFERRFKTLHGLVNDPQYGVNNVGNLQIDYGYLVGKVGLDATTGWAAYVDEERGKVFAVVFETDPDGDYPDDTSVQFFTAGEGYIYSRNTIKRYPNDQILNPPYLEIELLSPIREIKPGERIFYQYNMLASTIPCGCNAVDVSPFGVIAERLAANSDEGKVTITGKYGVFRKGYLKLQLKEGDMIVKELCCEKVHPFNGIVIHFDWLSGKDLGRSIISLNLYDEDETLMGKLDSLNPPLIRTT